MSGDPKDHDHSTELTEIERYSFARSALERVDPRAKVAFVLAALIVNIIWPGYRVPAVLLALAGAAVVAQRVPLSSFFLRLTVPAYMALAIMLAQSLFGVQGEVLLAAGPIHIRDAALLKGARLAAVVVGGSSLVLALSLTVPLTQMLAVASWARIPPIFVELAGLIYRYVFLLLEEAQRIREAQRVRLGWVTWKRAINSTATLMGMIIERAYDRSQDVYAAMTVRGYDGRLPLVEGSFPGRRLGRDLAGAGALTALLALLAAL